MIFKHTPLYRYLLLCENSQLEKTILDCGSGGSMPPLSLFKKYGYETNGIEFNDNQLDLANEFAKSQDEELNIIKGDMRELSFESNSISFVYSYNSIFHMRKKDIKKSLDEMIRVIKQDGLMFINFLSTDDFRSGVGNDLGNLELEQEEDGEMVIHSYFTLDEAENYFQGMQILFKETRIVERVFEGEWIKQGFVDYILRKK